MPSDNKKRVSCKRCQDRKIKCSRTSPCQRCTAAGVQCEFRGDGLKRAPISREYVKALESRVETLEGFLSQLKAASDVERGGMLDSICVPFQQSSLTLDRSYQMSLYNEISYQSELTKYNGTASLSNSSLLTTPTQHFEFPASPVSMFDITSRVEFSAEIITHCVALFFHWSHQYCSIVDREQFLVTYLELSSSKTYAHLALEYAICALGALSCPETRNLAESFSLASTQNFEMGGLYFPSHTSIQAFLLSSYYQIGKGDFSKAWMLAGIAFRMSEDLMYNDKNEEANQGTLRDIDIDSRRRMFMTCYESDKMISLMVGRSPIISVTPPHCIIREQQESSIWNEWLRSVNLAHLEVPDIPLNTSLISQKQVELLDIVKESITHASTWSLQDTPQRKSRNWLDISIHGINSKFLKWHNALPSELRWNRWGSNTDIVLPNLANLHMVYHLSHLSLNLPLLDGNNLNKSTSALAITAREICDFSLDVILSIFRRYKYQYSFESVSLIFVQGAILAAETILVMYGTHADRKPLSQSVNLRFLEEVLKDMESMWGIAGSARNELQRRTQGDANKNPALSCELSPIESMGLGNTGQLSDSQDIQPGEQGAFNSICEFIEMDSGIPFMYPELTTRESLTWQDDFAKPFEIEFSGDLGYWPSDL